MQKNTEIKMNLKVLQSKPSDLKQIKSFLKKMNLPLEGLEDQFHNYFIIKDNLNVIGSIGLEIYEKYGLLRSLAVHPDFRYNNISKKLVNSVLKLGRKNNLQDIYLLTESARDYFIKHKFIEIKRNLAPKEKKNSIEFSRACPDSATLMKLIL